VLLLFRAQNDPKALRFQWLRTVAQKLANTLNPHIYAVACFTFISISVLFNAPEAVYLCLAGVGPDQPPPTFTAFESFICHKSPECLSKEDSTEYIIAGIFLILMVS